MSFFHESWLFLYGTVNHFFLMMYWVWIPALLLSAYLFTRYHERLQSVLQEPGLRLLKLLALALSGLAHPRAVFLEAQTLGAKEPSRLAGAFILSAPHLVLYRLSVIMALVGLEFALGQLLGAVVMLAVLSWFSPALGTGTVVGQVEPPATIGAYLRHEGRAAWPLLYGLLLSGLIGAAGRREWWIDLSEAGGGGVVTALLNALVGSGLAVVSFAPPMANLFTASWLWKAYGLGYTGVVAFILAGSVNPWAIREYAKTWGWSAAGQLTLAGLLSSVVGALVISTLFWLLGLQITHTPWFHTIVNPIMNFMSLGGGMM